jgi:SPP1 gp7 family putative phage head morphogenesis protein
MKALPPLRLKDKYYRYIRDEITRIFDELVYQPLAKAVDIPVKEIRNAKKGLLEAVRTGTIWYQGGTFYGTFNAATTQELRRIGAQWNGRDGTWSIAPGDMPPEISMAQANAELEYQNIQRKVLQTLDNIKVESINRLSDVPDKYMQTIDWMEGDFQRSINAIAIPPKLTEMQRGAIAAEWGQNLDLYIKSWTEQNILKLRTEVQSNAFEGRRASQLVKHLQENYGVAKRKAEFLARQETSLLMSKFRETRYKDIGANTYKWVGAMDSRERPDHKALEGKVFDWTSPPVVDQRTGRRGHPGEDFGCRCVAVALIN